MQNFYWRSGLVLGLFTLMAFGCAGLEIKRGVEGNRFHSSANPKIDVEVGEGYKYLGEKSAGRSQFAVNSERSANFKTEVYRFSNSQKGSVITIQIDTLVAQRISWQKFDYKKLPNLIEGGVETLGGEKYQYGIYTFANDRGCYLTKQNGRRVGGDSATNLTIYYLERLGAKSVFNQWRNPGTLSGEQRARLNAFLKNWTADINFKE